MKNTFAIATATLLLLIYGPFTNGQEDQAEKSIMNVRQLYSVDETDREKVLEYLSNNYQKASGALVKSLAEIVQQHRGDGRYMSSMHCAILAVREWRVFESEDLLLSIVNYKLDSASLPLGMDVGGEYFYPAASALVSLRVEPQKIIHAMCEANSKREVQLLLWVLVQRTGSREEAQRVLEPSKSNENIAAGIELLSGSEDLLPTRNSTTGRIKAE